MPKIVVGRMRSHLVTLLAATLAATLAEGCVSIEAHSPAARPVTRTNRALRLPPPTSRQDLMAGLELSFGDAVASTVPLGSGMSSAPGRFDAPPMPSNHLKANADAWLGTQDATTSNAADEDENKDEQDPQDVTGDDEWDYSITPYLWTMSLKGHVTVKGTKTELDLSFSDILKDLNYGFFVHQEAWKGNNGVMMDVFVANLQSDSKISTGAPPPDATISLDSDVLIALAEADYLHRIDEEARIDAFVGARWTYERVSIRGSGIPNVRKTQSWVDPVIGLRKTWVVSERDAFRVRGDVGGLGVNNHNSWQLMGGWSRKVTERGAIDIAARVLSQDYKSGSGADEFRWNARMVGLVLGWRFSF